MPDLHSPPQSWSQLYQHFQALAESTRGMVTVTDPDEGHLSFPRTTSKDINAIASVFDGAIEGLDDDALVTRWEAEGDLLSDDPADDLWMYVGNRSFWATLGVAADALDAAHAPLPGAVVIEDATQALRAPRAESEPRNAGALLVTVFSDATWRGMAMRQLAFFRRLRGVGGDAPFMPDVPRTCNSDVLRLAEYWTEQLGRIGRSAGETCGRLVHSCWRDVLVHVVRHARRGIPDATYPRNDEFWEGLLLLTTQSDACTAHPAPWKFRGPTVHRRNAEAIDLGAVIEFPATSTYDEGARMQRDKLAQIHGEDRVTGRLITRVPRTTNDEVRQLAAWWRDKLAHVGEHNFADISYRHVLDRWRAALADVERIAPDADPSDVYAHNTDFWEAVLTIAIQIAVTAEAPTRWQLVKAAAKHVITGQLESAWLTILNHPYLSAGIGLGSLALLKLAFRRPPIAEPHP